MKKSLPRQSKLKSYIDSYNFGGVIVGSLFLYASFLPSLLPRGWVLQGVLSGILFSIGYSIGLLVSYIAREFSFEEPGVQDKRKIKRITYIVLDCIYLIFLMLGYFWQRQVSRLVGQPTKNFLGVVGTTLVLIVTVMFLVWLGRNLVHLFRWLKRRILKYIPPRIAFVLSAALTILIVVGLVNRVILNTVGDIVNHGFSVKNSSTDAGVTKPTVAELSGSPQSLIKWESLGRQGRKFVSNGQDTTRISEFNHAPAKQPIRVYAGLESANSTKARAELAVKELDRTGAFNRKVLVVITTTGTGWVDEQGVEGLEFMYGGDTAMVATQYSYLPSWMSFLVDQSKAQAAGIELYNAVLAKWQHIPVASRPKLVMFGESLGSFGSESAYTGWSAFSATTDGAVWVGPPNFNHLWRPTTLNRDQGSPEILPVVEQGKNIRFATKPADLTSLPLSNWGAQKAVYLQNPSDPIVWWSPNLIFHKPDWLSEKRGADVSPHTMWLPVVSFWQVSGDMMFSTGVPDNHGHKYGVMPTVAWSQVAPPAGWTSQRTTDLVNYLTH